jgi:hypothetical protein
MKGRYKLIEKSIMLRQYVRASIRVDVWNGTGLKPKERKEVCRELVDWVLKEFEYPSETKRKGAAA